MPEASTVQGLTVYGECSLDITPEQCAEIFCNMVDSQQVEFLEEVTRLFSAFKNTGAMQMECMRSNPISHECRQFVGQLNEYFNGEE